MPYGEVSGGVGRGTSLCRKVVPGTFPQKPGFPDPPRGGSKRAILGGGGGGGQNVHFFGNPRGPPFGGGGARTRFGGHFCHLLEIVRLASAEPFPKDA